MVPHPGTYSYSVGSTINGTFTTTESNENVTVGGIYANGLTTITVKHGSQVVCEGEVAVRQLRRTTTRPDRAVGCSRATRQARRDRSNRPTGARWSDRRNGTDGVTGRDRANRVQRDLLELRAKPDRRVQPGQRARPDQRDLVERRAQRDRPVQPGHRARPARPAPTCLASTTSPMGSTQSPRFSFPAATCRSSTAKGKRTRPTARATS